MACRYNVQHLLLEIDHSRQLKNIKGKKLNTSSTDSIHYCIQYHPLLINIFHRNKWSSLPVKKERKINIKKVRCLFDCLFALLLIYNEN